MTAELMADIAQAIATWLSKTWTQSFIQAYRMDWTPEIFYAEWIQAPYDGPGTSHYTRCCDHQKRNKPGTISNGTSRDRDAVRPLQELLQAVEEKHGVIIDHVYAVKGVDRISALWHVPGSAVRKFGTAPAAPVIPAGATPSAFVNQFIEGADA